MADAAADDRRAQLEALCARRDLSEAESYALFSAVMRGELAELELAAMLVALKTKGETAAELAGAARAMRDAALPFDTGMLAVADSCGTGGDGAGTLNISTAAGIVAAAGGVHVAKHGNRSVSSRSGSADVLERLGVRIDAPPELSRRCLEEAGICFLMAPAYHAGVRHAMPVRRALGVRTIFNLLGPLANPARPRFQVMGTYDPRWCVPLAETLALLGVERALVVHGGGLDEIALHAPTTAALVENGVVRSFTIEPSQFGAAAAPLGALAGGSPEENAAALEALFDREGSGAHEDSVAVNAGALLWIAGKAASHAIGFALAKELLASGAAKATLEKWREVLRGA